MAIANLLGQNPRFALFSTDFQTGRLLLATLIFAHRLYQLLYHMISVFVNLHNLHVLETETTNKHISKGAKDKLGLVVCCHQCCDLNLVSFPVDWNQCLGPSLTRYKYFLS